MNMNGSTVIRRTVEDVSKYVLNVSNDASWRYGVDQSGYRSGDSFTPGSIGYTRTGGVEVEWEVVSVNPLNNVEWKFLNGPFKGRGGYRFDSVEEGTKFTLFADVKPTGFYRFLGPVFRWTGKRRNQSDVEKLRKILESPGNPEESL